MVAYPDGFRAHLVDPVNLLLYVPGYLLGGGGVTGAVLGWNLLHLGAAGIAVWGCWALGGQLYGSSTEARFASALLVVVFGFGSTFLAHPYLGRTELLPAALLPVHLFWLRRALVSGELRSAGVAGLVLGLAALGGSYLATFLLLFEIPVALALAWAHAPERRSGLAILVLTAVVALVLSLPAFLALLADPPSGMHGRLRGSLAGLPMPEGNPALRMSLLGWLRLDAPPDLSGQMDRPLYLGVVALVLGIVGAMQRPRRAAGWLGLGLFLGVLGVGTSWRVLGTGDGMTMPAHLLIEWIPPLRALTHWERIGVVASLPLGVAAGHGLAAVWPRVVRLGSVLGTLAGHSELGGRIAGILVGVLVMVAGVVDQASWPAALHWPRPTFDVRAPQGLLEGLEQVGDGAVMHLPLPLPIWKDGETVAAEEPSTFLLWQAQHGRAVSATPSEEIDRELLGGYLARLVMERQYLLAAPEVPREGRRAGRLRGTQAAVTDDERACVARDARRLHEEGFAAILVHRDGAYGEGVEAFLVRALGLPTQRGEELSTWDLAVVAERFATVEPENECVPPLPNRSMAGALNDEEGMVPRTNQDRPAGPSVDGAP
jgi:hypothetical protein